MDIDSFIRTQNTVFQLLKDRRYVVEDTKKLSVEEIENFMEDNEDITMTFQKRNGSKILIMWHLTDNVGISVIQDCCQRIQDEHADAAILVKIGKLTPAANAALSTEVTKNVQVFDIDELLNNVTTHSLVPKHEILPVEEQDKLLKIYKVTRIQLPRIFTSDPIVKYYAWKKGNIIKITRKNGEVYYRCVV